MARSTSSARIAGSTLATRPGRPARPARRGRRSDPPEQLAVSAWLRLLKIQALIQRELRGHVESRCTFPQFDVLNQLDREPRGITFVELSRRLLVTAGNLTGIVERLERDGLVRRTVHPEDRRAFRLTVTPRGRGLLRRTQREHHRVLAGLLAVVPAADLRALRRLLGQLRDGLESRLTGAPRAR